MAYIACSPVRFRLSFYLFIVLPVLAAAGDRAAAQQDLLRPGEAFATRFSGTAQVNGSDGKPMIALDPAGIVGSIIDVRAPGRRPAGEHWVNEPQRNPVRANEVGQVFGVALDAASPPNIFLAATSAFGLHRDATNSQWMAGMWGQGGGPGSIYVLDRESGYRPRLFANISLNGRPNGGPGLGNIAFDKWNRQLFVSDLETGMIHRLRAGDGGDLGFYDHGVQGRANFRIADNGQASSLPPIPFDPASAARISDCPNGRFDNSPECWNFATSGRRVWGLAVWKHPVTGETRLYYSVWSSPSFGDATWGMITDEADKRNSIWSIRLGPDGGFVPTDVRREIIMPDFQTDADTIARSGYSSPVSDISFPECGGTGIMLLGERGGIRNLGLDANNPFATPHESRALQAGLNQQGNWSVIGRYDVGFYNRRLDGEPFVRSNCAGGVAFGPGYTPSGMINPAQPDQFTWISGDALCSVDGPCNNPAGHMSAAGPQSQAAPEAQPASSQQPTEPDDSEVHGLQGMPIGLFSQITPPRNANDPQTGTDQAYLIDLDINVGPGGAVLPDTLLRNDATKIGDVAVYQICADGAAPPLPGAQPPPPGIELPAGGFILPPTQVAHWPVFSHSRAGTHNPQYSHNRHGTHNPKLSHERERSHTRSMTHYRRISSPVPQGAHNRELSAHAPELSHKREESAHRSPQSHNPRASTDQPVQSHNRKPSHVPDLSHNTRLTHLTAPSHTTRMTHQTAPSHRTGPSHLTAPSHRTEPSHDTRLTHRSAPSHLTAPSHKTGPSHRSEDSSPHDIRRTHLTEPSHAPKGSHQTPASNPHNTELSHRRDASGHTQALSHRTQGSHSPPGSHLPAISHRPQGSHNTRISHRPPASHNPQISHRPSLSHNPRISHRPLASHNTRISTPRLRPEQVRPRPGRPNLGPRGVRPRFEPRMGPRVGPRGGPRIGPANRPGGNPGGNRFPGPRGGGGGPFRF